MLYLFLIIITFFSLGMVIYDKAYIKLLFVAFLFSMFILSLKYDGNGITPFIFIGIFIALAYRR